MPPLFRSPRAAVVAVCTKFSAAAIAVKLPLSAIAPLQVAVCALQPTQSHFTPLHAELLKCSLLAKCYYAARPLLEQELLHVNKDATLVAPRDLLLHHYYAGMAETGLKRYRSAVQHFTLCVSAYLARGLANRASLHCCSAAKPA